MEEVWKDVPRYEGLYQVSSFGRINSTGRIKKILKPWKDKRGYAFVSLSYPRQPKKNFLVHRLVAMAFHGMKDGLMVCHNDGDVTNNAPENLRWDTNYGNCQDTIKHGRSTRGEKDAMSKLSEKQVLEMREYHKKGVPCSMLAVDYGISERQAYRIIKRERWAWL